MALAGDMGHQMNPALGYLLGECWEVPKPWDTLGKRVDQGVVELEITSGPFSHSSAISVLARGLPGGSVNEI